MGVGAMVIYFACWLMIIKNVYSHNDYLLELLLLKVIFSKKWGCFYRYVFLTRLFFWCRWGGYESIFKFVSTLF